MVETTIEYPQLSHKIDIQSAARNITAPVPDVELSNKNNLKDIYDIYTRVIRFNLGLHMSSLASNFTGAVLSGTSGIDQFVEFLHHTPDEVEKVVYEIRHNDWIRSIPNLRPRLIKLVKTSYESPLILSLLQSNDWLDESRMDDDFRWALSHKISQEFSCKIDEYDVKVCVFSLALNLWINELEFQLPL
ncbi:uncharacterized protein SPAPADRAFT_61503 [Spathaspora passalidarum NRRL Y-27907]|uniref:Uncharacterized protein n=1 Tax=Spathaspora passalidarum (strain NRRL Y-27907 / 11-Y1) TaxID=619300 RepID=G3AN18_SPAPN|nr:uncharacterized protein SPAPADRAFT_61503 [Spathaspora passalidarum NRRL Y-27907]EGW32432.1 hypothetical protein SPAPADRAFT_61503 [Spathaspora passalidarum NRRL Y-27907]